MTKDYTIEYQCPMELNLPEEEAEEDQQAKENGE